MNNVSAKRLFFRNRQVMLFGFCLLAFSFVLIYAGKSMGHDFESGNLFVMHPYASPTPPGAQVAAGYLEISNNGSQADRLLSGSAVFAERVEIHRTEIENDVAKMRQLEDGLSLPANTVVTLSPGATHLMFIGLAEPLILGERYQATLLFEQAGEVLVEFWIEEAGGQETMDHSKMKHGMEMKHDN